MSRNACRRHLSARVLDRLEGPESLRSMVALPPLPPRAADGVAAPRGSPTARVGPLCNVSVAVPHYDLSHATPDAATTPASGRAAGAGSPLAHGSEVRQKQWNATQ